jgi:hypothetical protein
VAEAFEMCGLCFELCWHVSVMHRADDFYLACVAARVQYWRGCPAWYAVEAACRRALQLLAGCPDGKLGGKVGGCLADTVSFADAWHFVSQAAALDMSHAKQLGRADWQLMSDQSS